jgi:hypothetical protein
VPIEIRSATTADAEAIQRIYAPFVLETAISFEDLPPSVDEVAGRITSTLKTHLWLVAVVGGKSAAMSTQARIASVPPIAAPPTPRFTSRPRPNDAVLAMRSPSAPLA